MYFEVTFKMSDHQHRNRNKFSRWILQQLTGMIVSQMRKFMIQEGELRKTQKFTWVTLSHMCGFVRYKKRCEARYLLTRCAEYTYISIYASRISAWRSCGVTMGTWDFCAVSVMVIFNNYYTGIIPSFVLGGWWNKYKDDEIGSMII